MAKERVIQCQHYLHEGCCDLGKKECRFWKEMQTCPTYSKLIGGKPIRTDTRKQKLNRILKKEKWD